MNGNLALKIRNKDFRELILGADVIFLQETWLRPSQEDSLELPQGFVLAARSRPDERTFTRQWGGVAVIVRSDIPHSVVVDVSTPDLLVLDMNVCFLIGAYLPPSGSYWGAWTDVDPEQKLQEAIAYCCASKDNMVLLLGDLNARTASKSSRYPRSPRQSADSGCNARGSRLLQWCSANHLSILNGTTAERDSPGALTSFQAQGASVVDYAIASAPHAEWVWDGDMVVERNHWSDHSLLTVTLTLPTGVLCLEQSGIFFPPQPQPPPRICTYLDRLAAETVERAGNHTAAQLYGVATEFSAPATVYMAVAGSNQGPKSMFALYWGCNHHLN